MKLKNSIILTRICPIDEHGKIVSVCPFCKKQVCWRIDERRVTWDTKCEHLKDQQITPSGQTLIVGYVLEI